MSKSVEVDVVTAVTGEKEKVERIKLKQSPELAKVATEYGEGPLKLYSLKAVGEACSRNPETVRQWMKNNAGRFLGGSGVDTTLVEGEKRRVFYSLEQMRAAKRHYDLGDLIEREYFKPSEVAGELGMYLPEGRSKGGVRQSTAMHHWFDSFPDTREGVKNIYGVEVVRYKSKSVDEYYLPRKVHLFTLTHDEGRNLAEVRVGLPRLYRNLGEVTQVSRDDDSSDRMEWIIKAELDGSDAEYRILCRQNTAELQRIKKSGRERMPIPLTSQLSDDRFAVQIYDLFKVDRVALASWGERVYWEHRRHGLDPKYRSYIFLPEVAKALGVHIGKVKHQVHDSHYDLGIEGDEKVPGSNPACIHPRLARHIIERTSTRRRLRKTHLPVKKLAKEVGVSYHKMKSWVQENAREDPHLTEEFEGGVYVRNPLSEEDYEQIRRIPNTRGRLLEYQRVFERRRAGEG